MSSHLPRTPPRYLWFRAALLADGWADRVRITIDAGRIARLEKGVDAQDGEERHSVGVPGLANLHSHAFQRGMAGLAEVRSPSGDSFWTWREAMFRFLGRVGADELEAIAAQAYVEMLEAGFTHVGEFHYLHHDRDGTPFADPGEMLARLAAAASETGIGLTLLPVFYAHAGFGGVPPAQGQRRFITKLDSYARLVDIAERTAAALDGATFGLAPHSLRAVTPAELTELVALAGDGPIHIHAAEQMQEVRDSIAWSGQRPVEWLLDHAGLDDRWCIVHATHTTDDETRRLAESGAVIGLCPITEAHLGDGIFAGDTFRAAAGRWGVGTDSNILIDAAGELRALEYSQRLRLRSRNVLADADGRSVGRSLFDAAAAGGAQALGRSPAVIAEGAPADLVSLDATHPALAGGTGDAWLDAWIFAAKCGAVDSVWRWGRQVVAGGVHVRRDTVAARFRAALARVRA